MASAQTQTTGASFGSVIGLGGTPSDGVLDESRGRLYLVNDRANRIDVYDINQKKVITFIRVGSRCQAVHELAIFAWRGLFRCRGRRR